MKTTLILRNKNAKGLTLIYLKVFFGDVRKYFIYSTGESILSKKWNFKTQQPTNEPGIKIQVNRYVNFFNKLVANYTITNKELTIEIARKEFDKEFKKVVVKETFFSVYDAFMIYKQKIRDWSPSTVKRYINIKNILIDFETDRNYKLTFNRINDNFYTEFTDYCMTDKGHINNTFSRNVGLFKTFMLWSLKNGYTYKKDFMSFKKKPRVVTKQIALNFEDLQKLMTTEFKTPRLEKVRDVFVFACVTGMRFGELKLISQTNIVNTTLFLKEEKGAGKDTREIPLNNIALFILRKYNHKLPLIANQKHNDYIKEVFLEAGYTHDVEKTTTKGKEVIRETMPFYDRISSHTARRTFITMMKRKGSSDKLIAKITGHSDMKTLNQYYQISDSDTKDAVNETFNIEIPLQKIS